MKYNKLMDLASEIGSRLAIAGAETYRIEDSVVRILHAYGLTAKVYSVPNSLIITILIPDGPPITRLCRMDSPKNDLDAVEQYNNLSRRICAEVPDPQLALQWLHDTEKARKQYTFPTTLLGYILVACGFSVFFGGNLKDCLCSGVCGLLLGFVTHYLDKLKVNTFFSKIAAAFIMSFAAYAISAIGFANNADSVVIGALMLLVPGLLFTNALRDIIYGDTNSGINRIVEVLLIAVAVTLGTAAAWNLSTHIWGTPVFSTPLSYHPAITCFVSFVACTGFVIVFNIHGYGNLLCALGGAVTWVTYCIAAHFGFGEFVCYFIAAIVAAVFSESMARLRKYPAISYLVISLLPLIPGAGIYYTAQQAVQGNLDGFLSYGSQTLAIAGVIAAGILLVSTIVRAVRL